MEDHTDKRVFECFRHAAIIEISYFNRSHFYEDSTINHCDEGLCFKSEVPLKPGATVLIRAKSLHPNSACNGGFPNTILEAISVRLPIIASPVGEIEHYVSKLSENVEEYTDMCFNT